MALQLRARSEAGDRLEQRIASYYSSMIWKEFMLPGQLRGAMTMITGQPEG